MLSFIRGNLSVARREAERVFRAKRSAPVAKLDAQPAGISDPHAEFGLGWGFLHGIGVNRDLPRAVFHLERAAEVGHVEAQFTLASIYQSGDENVPSEAARWYAAARKVDPIAAETRCKLMFPHGVSVPRNPQRSLQWAEAAGAGGKPEAQALSALFHAHGFGCERDYKEARRWYELAATHGIAQAELGLGAIFAYGLGVERDDVAATSWYRKAAAQGDPNAQFALAMRYIEGVGPAGAPGEAVALLQKAAEQEFPAALHRLAVMQLAGDPSMPRDLVQVESRLRAAARLTSAGA